MGVRTALVGVAVVATAAMVGQYVLASPAEGNDFPVLAMHGTGPLPLVDGDDDRDRHEVAVDHALLLQAAAEARAAAVGATADDGLSANDRALVGDLAAVGWGGLEGQSLPLLSIPEVGEGRVAVRRAVADALLELVEGVEEVNPVGGNRYEVVGTDLRAAALLAVDGVASVDEVGLVVPTATDDPHLSHQWGLVNTGQVVQGRAGVAGRDVGYADSAGRADGTGVVVAIVDSGIQTDHPDLAGRFWANEDEVCGNGRDDDDNGYVDDCGGWDFVNHDGSVHDAGVDNRHGTHVAGIVAARSDDGIGVASVAHGASIMPLKVFQGGSAPVSRVTAAIEYAVDNGADVINLSLGGPYPSSSQEAAIERARQAGVLVVVAAGNDGSDNDARPTYPASYDLDNIIAVGSHRNDGGVSSFSNHGSTSVDVFAPGEHVLSTVPGSSWAYLSGTSMAAPMVTAVAAATAHSWGTTDATEVRQRVLEAVVEEPAFTNRAVTNGRVSAALALSPEPAGPADGTQPGNRGVPAEGELVATVEGAGDPAPTSTSVTGTLQLDRAVSLGADVDVQLVRWYDDAVWAVVDHPVDVTLGGETTSLTTDEDGRLRVASLDQAQRTALEAGELTIAVGTELPAAPYALVLHATAADGSAASRPMAVFLHTRDEVPGDDGTPGGPGAGDTPGDGSDGGSDGGAGDGPGGGAGDGTGGGGGSTPPGDGSGDGSGGDGSGGDGRGIPAPGVGIGAPGGGSSGGDGSGGDGSGDDGDGPGGDGSGDGVVVVTPAPGDGSGGEGSGGGGTGGPGGGSNGDRPVDTPVWPDRGPDFGGTWVTIDGEFDPSATYYVHFGDQVHAPAMVTTWAIGVSTRASAPGLVDVVVRGGEQELTYADAFTYEATRGGDGGTDGGTGDGPGTDGGAPGDGGGTAPDPGSGGGDGDAGDPGAGGGDGTAETPDGMRLARITEQPVAGLRAADWGQCLSGSCTGVPLGALPGGWGGGDVAAEPAPDPGGEPEPDPAPGTGGGTGGEGGGGQDAPAPGDGSSGDAPAPGRGGDACDADSGRSSTLAVRKLDVGNDKLQLELENGGADVAIECLGLVWPTSNTPLEEVKLGGKKLFDDSSDAGAMTLDVTVLERKHRTIREGKHDKIELKFDKKTIARTGYRIVLRLSDGSTFDLDV